MGSLNKVLVTLYTRDTGKFPSTVLSVFLDRSGFEIAGVRAIISGLGPNSTSGPHPLSIFLPGDECEAPDYGVTLRIDPVQIDIWTFDCEIYIAFENGAELTRRFENLRLDHEARLLRLVF